MGHPQRIRETPLLRLVYRRAFSRPERAYDHPHPPLPVRPNAGGCIFELRGQLPHLIGFYPIMKAADIAPLERIHSGRKSSKARTYARS